MRIIIERASASTCMFEDSFVTVSAICNWDIKRSPFKKVAGNLYYGDLIFHLTKSFFNLKMISDKENKSSVQQEQETSTESPSPQKLNMSIEVKVLSKNLKL